MPRAIEELGAMATAAKSETAKLGAIREIFDRAVGKAPQAMLHSGTIGTYDLTKATDDELAILAAILMRISAATGDELVTLPSFNPVLVEAPE